MSIERHDLSGAKRSLAITTSRSWETAMKRILSALVLIGTGVVIANAPARAADDSKDYDVNCNVIIAGTGRVTHVEGSHDWTYYGGKIPPGLARRRAIDNWEATVAANCPRHVTKWWRSKSKDIECDAGAGHEYCTATAVPGKKLFGWLIPE